MTLGLVKYSALPTYSGQKNTNLHPDSPNPVSQIPRLFLSLLIAPIDTKCSMALMAVVTYCDNFFNPALGKLSLHLNLTFNRIIKTDSSRIERSRPINLNAMLKITGLTKESAKRATVLPHL